MCDSMPLKLITFSPDDLLVQSVARGLNLPITIPTITRFADGEIEITLADPEQYQEAIVLLIQSTNFPAHEKSMGISFLAHELKNAGAKKVIAVVPYFGYARHDESSIAGKPGHSFVLARLFEGAGVDHIICVELHNPNLVNYFKIAATNVLLDDLIANHIKNSIPDYQQGCLVAPDAGAVDRVKRIAGKLGMHTIVYEKKRYAPDKTRLVTKYGLRSTDLAIVVDDIIDTGGTALQVSQDLQRI